MSNIQIKRGTLSNIITMFIQDNNGVPKTGLTFESINLQLSFRRQKFATVITYKQSEGNIESISTLGTFAQPTTGKIRFKEINPTVMAGQYELQLRDDSGVFGNGDTSTYVTFTVSEETTVALNLFPSPLVIELMATDNQNPLITLDDNSDNDLVIAKAFKTTDVSLYSPVIGSPYVDLKDILDLLNGILPLTQLASQADILNIQNNTLFSIGLPNDITIPAEGSSIVVPIFIQLIDEGGNPEDPDSNEIAISARYINLQSDSDKFYNDETHLAGSTESSTWADFYKAVKMDTGIYKIYFLAEYKAVQDSILFTFRYKETTVQREYTRVIQQFPNTVGDAILSDNNTNKNVIIKAIKNLSASGITNITSSIYDDIISRLNLITAKLPSTTISNLALNTAIDTGLTLKDCLELSAAMLNGRFIANTPSEGDITFYKRDNTTVLTIVHTTDIERSRV
jgi:hypothetical protein